MKINFSCGKQTWPDFYCIDAVAHPKATRAPDLLHTIQFDEGFLINPIPLGDSCADELHSYHFLEHVYAWEAPALVAEWRRLLKRGGKLILELPNLILACQNLLAGKNDQWGMWPLYGNQETRDPFMCHRTGYTPATVTKLLADHGFINIKVLPPVTHGAKANRDMRVEAVKA
jgi:predicted SAM-dependent methyltransferase